MHFSGDQCVVWCQINVGINVSVNSHETTLSYFVLSKQFILALWLCWCFWTWFFFFRLPGSHWWYGIASEICNINKGLDIFFFLHFEEFKWRSNCLASWWIPEQWRKGRKVGVKDKETVVEKSRIITTWGSTEASASHAAGARFDPQWSRIPTGGKYNGYKIPQAWCSP